jgi:phosphopantothenoylcysteine decarboxylase/phosphopantothenate--cysteine ligase
MQKISSTDIFISDAAVADFKVHKISEEKIKKSDSTQKLVRENTLDILSQVTTLNDAPFTVGFAAETENVEINAQKKMHSKNLDMIAANKVAKSDIGFDSEFNEVMLITREEEVFIPRCDKRKLARKIINYISNQL